ncbi:MAG: hypothetical protein H3C47_00965 [Candidatus Cloacimonetes bacterium]|nr:hypothetical protein [Candidatus Cloacimonadota bacterium]
MKNPGTGVNLYTEYMLNRISREQFLRNLVELPDTEQKRVLAIRNMQIFEETLNQLRGRTLANST